MEIETRIIDKKHIAIKIKYWGTSIDLGIFNKQETEEFLGMLDGVISDLESFLGKE